MGREKYLFGELTLPANQTNVGPIHHHSYFEIGSRVDRVDVDDLLEAAPKVCAVIGSGERESARARGVNARVRRSLGNIKHSTSYGTDVKGIFPGRNRRLICPCIITIVRISLGGSSRQNRQQGSGKSETSAQKAAQAQARNTNTDDEDLQRKVHMVW